MVDLLEKMKNTVSNGVTIDEQEADKELAKIGSWGREIIELGARIDSGVGFSEIKGYRAAILMAGYKCDTISSVSEVFFSSTRMIVRCNDDLLEYRIDTSRGLPVASPIR